MALVTREGDVPVFVAGQVIRRWPLVGWLSDRVLDVFDRWGSCLTLEDTLARLSTS